ncbi:hypothetical protein B0J17DRAFT_633290 [Rhizoctonia solani]|nr:hypothetical protein B0J17DRAFT_633290 [Rhizoctonia solani]
MSGLATITFPAITAPVLGNPFQSLQGYVPGQIVTEGCNMVNINALTLKPKEKPVINAVSGATINLKGNIKFTADTSFQTEGPIFTITYVYILFICVACPLMTDKSLFLLAPTSVAITFIAGTFIGNNNIAVADSSNTVEVNCASGGCTARMLGNEGAQLESSPFSSFLNAGLIRVTHGISQKLSNISICLSTG